MSSPAGAKGTPPSEAGVGVRLISSVNLIQCMRKRTRVTVRYDVRAEESFESLLQIFTDTVLHDGNVCVDLIPRSTSPSCGLCAIILDGFIIGDVKDVGLLAIASRGGLRSARRRWRGHWGAAGRERCVTQRW